MRSSRVCAETSSKGAEPCALEAGVAEVISTELTAKQSVHGLYYSCMGDGCDAAFCFSCSLSRQKIHPNGAEHEFERKGEEEAIGEDKLEAGDTGDDDDVAEVHLDDGEVDEVEEDEEDEVEEDEDEVEEEEEESERAGSSADGTDSAQDD